MATADLHDVVPAASAGYNRMKEVLEFDESKVGVKTLSDSGITSIPRIFIHPPKILSDLKPNHKKTSPSHTIPTIDLSNINSPTHHAHIVNQIGEAASKWGFFQIINHSVSIDVMNNVISAIKTFHELPIEVKSKHYVRDESHAVKFLTNYDLLKSPAACWHDSLVIQMAPQPLDPNNIPEICRKQVLQWEVQATAVADTVEGLLAEGLGLEAGKFKDLSFSETKVFAGSCYPYCPQPDLTVGITPHTDSQIVTVLLPNQVPGLQVKHGDEWVDVKPVHGGLIINVGDFLQVISNGQYQSVQHRVLANPSKELRISLVMFFGLSRWKENDMYGPLPELLSPIRPAIYRNFTKQEFLENLYAKGFDSRSWIENIKI